MEFVIDVTLKVNDDEYAVLASIDNEEEAYVFKIVSVDGEDVFEPVDSEEELQIVADAYEELLDKEDEQ